MSKDIILNVPIFKQNHGDPSCALACAQMLFAYWGDKIPLEELERETYSNLAENRMGITPVTAQLFAKRGYNVHFRTYQIELLDENTTYKSEENINVFISNYEEKRKYKGSYFQQWEEFIDLIRAGGQFSTRLSTLEEIDDYLAEGVPVRLSVSPRVMFPHSRDTGHAVVVSGKIGRNYQISDPGTKSTSRYTVQKDELLFSWYRRGAVMFAVQKPLPHKRKKDGD